MGSASFFAGFYPIHHSFLGAYIELTQAQIGTELVQSGGLLAVHKANAAYLLGIEGEKSKEKERQRDEK